MKKLIILLFVLFALNANAQFYTKIKPISSIEFGAKTRSLSFYHNSLDTYYLYEYPNNSFYFDINIGVNYLNFFLTSNVTTNFNKPDFSDVYLNPFLSEYYVDFYYSFKCFKIGYQHYCSHITLNSSNKLSRNNNYIKESHDKLFIKLILLL